MKYLLTSILLFINVLAQSQTQIDSLLQTGHYLQAIELLQTAEETSAKNYSLGKIYYDIGNYNKAILYFRKSLHLSDNQLVKQALAKTYKNNGNYKKAIMSYEDIVVKDSVNYLVLYKLGKLYAKTNKHVKAISIFDKLHVIDPKNPNYLYQKALSHTNLYDRANLFLAVYKLDTTHTKSMYHLAKFFKTIHDKDSSRLFVDKALYINPYDTKFLRLRINDLYKQKKYKLALEYAKQMDSLSPNNLFANQRMGLSYWKLKEYAKAKEYLRKATRIDREDKSSYYYLGLLHKDMKDFNKAKSYFLLAIYMDRPDVDNEFYNLGLIAQIEKKPKEAIHFFKESFKNNPKNYPALFEQAVMSDLYYKDKSIALKLYEKYLERFKSLNKENTLYVSKRINEINEVLFLRLE